MTIELVLNDGNHAVVADGALVVLDISPGEMDDNYHVARVVNSKTVKPFTTGTMLDEPVPGELVSGSLIDTDPRLHGPQGSLRFIPDN